MTPGIQKFTLIVSLCVNISPCWPFYLWIETIESMWEIPKFIYNPHLILFIYMKYQIEPNSQMEPRIPCEGEILTSYCHYNHCLTFKPWTYIFLYILHWFKILDYWARIHFLTRLSFVWSIFAFRISCIILINLLTSEFDYNVNMLTLIYDLIFISTVLYYEYLCLVSITYLCKALIKLSLWL